jgi:hypothetical protein
MSANRAAIFIYCDTICSEAKQTHDKNEPISLWLLEQDRQKNRARLLRETERTLVAQSPNTQDRLSFFYDGFRQDEEKLPIPIETSEYEQLMKKKAALEEQSRFLDEKQKQLYLHAKMLCRKIIQEIKKRNAEKQQTVTRLIDRVEKFEAQLRLTSSILEMKEENNKKQQEINQLREAMCALETQFGELGFSLISEEGETGKVENNPDTTQSEASKKENPESDRNLQALEIVGQSN